MKRLIGIALLIASSCWCVYAVPVGTVPLSDANKIQGHYVEKATSGSDGKALTYDAATGQYIHSASGTGSGTVTAVTASSPLSSSGGTTPNISLGSVGFKNMSGALRPADVTTGSLTTGNIQGKNAILQGDNNYTVLGINSLEADPIDGSILMGGFRNYSGTDANASIAIQGFNKQRMTLSVDNDSVSKITTGITGSTNSTTLTGDINSNIGFGGSYQWGTSAKGVISLLAGTAPTTSPANTGQFWYDNSTGFNFDKSIKTQGGLVVPNDVATKNYAIKIDTDGTLYTQEQ